MTGQVWRDGRVFSEAPEGNRSGEYPFKEDVRGRTSHVLDPQGSP